MQNRATKDNFDHQAYAWQPDVDYRAHPELYKVGKGEEGVLLCEPYKSEIVGYWRFRTPEIARESSQKILTLFYDYLNKNDFIGADMARKFLQMGFTRARRYANYKGGRKYDPETHAQKTKGTGDPIKVASASIFYDVWKQAEADEKYQSMKQEWKARYG
jgi:hypothetical protein